MTRDSLARTALLAVICTLPLGATPLELGNGVGAVVALGLIATGSRVRTSDLLGPALALGVGWLAFAGDPRFDLWDAVRRVWVLSPLVSVPILAAEVGETGGIARAGLGVAAITAVIPLVQVFATRDQGWIEPSGLFSHHLTLAYALLAPLSVAVWRREPWFAVPIAAAIASTGSAGPAIAATTVVSGVLAASASERPRAAVAGVGVVSLATAFVGMFAPQFAADLARRAVLWTGGAELALSGGIPAGAWRAAIAPVHRSWSPGFEFPHHAHDNLIQAAGDAGPGAWVAIAIAGALAWESCATPILALGAGLLVGGLTQDLFGDLEVIRALLVWTALLGTQRSA